MIPVPFIRGGVYEREFGAKGELAVMFSSPFIRGGNTEQLMATFTSATSKVLVPFIRGGNTELKEAKISPNQGLFSSPLFGEVILNSSA
ncbi:hypothetical protein [Lactovum odontotermitis]